MKIFDQVSGKELRPAGLTPHPVLNLLPPGHSLRAFYADYLTAHSWTETDVYYTFWRETDIAAMRATNNGGYPDRFFIFGGDGAGEYFGTELGSDVESYFCIPTVGSPEDISLLGGFADFLEALRTNNFIR